MPSDLAATGPSQTVHATTICIENKGALILGPSGAGKSALALRLISLGAVLVADDRTCLTLHKDRVIATCPPAIKGRIEARGVGIIAAPAQDAAAIELVIDLSQTTKDRLPSACTHTLLGQVLPCFHKADHVHFPDAILLYLRHSISDRA